MMIIILARQGVIVQGQQAGDQLGPARPRLWVMHPAALDHLRIEMRAH